MKKQTKQVKKPAKKKTTKQQIFDSALINRIKKTQKITEEFCKLAPSEEEQLIRESILTYLVNLGLSNTDVTVSINIDDYYSISVEFESDDFKYDFSADYDSIEDLNEGLIKYITAIAKQSNTCHNKSVTIDGKKYKLVLED